MTHTIYQIQNIDLKLDCQFKINILFSKEFCCFFNSAHLAVFFNFKSFNVKVVVPRSSSKFFTSQKSNIDGMIIAINTGSMSSNECIYN